MARRPTASPRRSRLAVVLSALVLVCAVGCRRAGKARIERVPQALQELDPEAAELARTLLGDDSARAADAAAKLYVLMVASDPANREAPEEIHDIVAAIASWALGAGSVPGLEAETPLPERARALYAGRTVLFSYSDPPDLRIERAYDVDGRVFRQLSPQEQAAVRDAPDPVHLDSLTKRGYAVGFVHHRIRGPLAFVSLGLGLLDVKLVFLRTGDGRECIHPSLVHWGPKTR